MRRQTTRDWASGGASKSRYLTRRTVFWIEVSSHCCPTPLLLHSWWHRISALGLRHCRNCEGSLFIALANVGWMWCRTVRLELSICTQGSHDRYNERSRTVHIGPPVRAHMGCTQSDQISTNNKSVCRQSRQAQWRYPEPTCQYHTLRLPAFSGLSVTTGLELGSIASVKIRHKAFSQTT
ncbi:uncharacterized protein C8Q71DRAFT_748435 [Rhodofomes roseus]|uniref:Uncharacterized protein n=1 Tax=Rhodofomes roseus TaxID=34475 RepID=A0ABQ8KMB3_9APHY|nr:uncharacterized protein C8Q71DRAFT_748435 [Rhodofomes roseus]KAH9839188.1 hypothetical protein C8Q71DRAFT_748435 [Rhodofomes roseus]